MIPSLPFKQPSEEDRSGEGVSDITRPSQLVMRYHDDQEGIEGWSDRMTFGPHYRLMVSIDSRFQTGNRLLFLRSLSLLNSVDTQKTQRDHHNIKTVACILHQNT